MVTTTTGLATSFIQFSRPGATGGGATVTDRDGKIKWAGHNLLTNSESFDASAWSRSGISAVTANSTAAPNGTTTADTVVEDTSASANHFVAQTPTIAAAQAITYGVWARRGSGTRNIAITIIASGGSDYISQVYDLGAGTLGSSTAVGTGVITDKTISSAGSGWYYITLTGTPSTTAAVTGGACRLALANGTTFGSQTYTGDGTSSVILWGAHLSFASLGGMVLNPARGDAYYPTTPRNLLGFTEDFSNAAWVKTNILAFGSGSVANAVVAPNGLQTADLIVPNTTSGAHSASQAITSAVSGTTYIASIYVKPFGYAKFGIRENAATGAYATFNLSGAGSVIAQGSGGTGAITALSDGWYRVSMSSAAGSTSFQSTFFVLDSAYSSGAPFGYNWSGDGTSGIYLWGAQLSDSASLDAYSPVYGAAVTSAAYYAPRLDYDANGSALGLLVEEQRTNNFTYSDAFDNAAWFKSNSSVTANTAVGPDGLTSADKVVENTATNEHYVWVNPSITGPYTISVYAKAAERSFVMIYGNGGWTWFNLSSGALGTVRAGATATITPAGNGWYRCAVSVPSGTGTFHAIGPASANGTNNYTGDGTSGVLIWGAQLEAGSFATSYIPTGASTATRTADVASVSTQAFPYSASASTLVANVSLLSVNTAGFKGLAAISDGTANNRIALYQAASATSAWQIVSSGGASQANITPGNVSANTPFKLGTAVASNDAAAYLGGVAGTPDPTVTMPAAATIMYIGGNASGGEPLNGWVRQITYLPRRLPNADLAARTV